MTASQKVQLLRCAASFVTAAYEWGAGLTAQGLGKLELGLLTLCLRPYALCLLFMPRSSGFARLDRPASRKLQPVGGVEGSYPRMAIFLTGKPRSEEREGFHLELFALPSK